MAALETTRVAPFGAIATYRFFKFIGNPFGAVSNWNASRVTPNGWGKLTDRELANIGLCGGDIEQI